MQTVIRAHSPQTHPAQVVLPGQIVTQTQVEVLVDIEDIALAMLAGLDNGLVGGQCLANAKAGCAVSIPADD